MGVEEGLLGCGRWWDVSTAVAEETVSGTIKGWRPDDQREHTMYCGAFSELARLIGQEKDARS